MPAASSAARHQAAASASSYSANGENSPRRSVNQHALADVDSTKPPAQGNGVHMKFARFGSDHETSRDSVSCS